MPHLFIPALAPLFGSVVCEGFRSQETEPVAAVAFPSSENV